MISLTNVIRTFPNQVNNFTLDIPTEQKVAIIGTSGSGKTTLLKLISGFEPIESGSLVINDQDLTHSLPHERDVIYVFQDNNHFPNLTIKENVALAFINQPKTTAHASTVDVHVSEPLTKAQQEQALMDMLAQLQITEIADKLPMHCSGGQLQRAALARAFLMQRKILLLDEPFSALDSTNRAIVAQALAKMNDKTMLLVTHNLEDVEGLVDRVITISQGKIVADELINNS